MEIGERIFVETPAFEGMATINYISPGEIFPIQIELDNPDQHGHKIKRVSEQEIKDQSTQVTNTEDEKPNCDSVLQLAKVRRRYKKYKFKIGEHYIVGPTRQNNGTHFYVYGPDDGRFKGCMPTDMFLIVSAHNGPLPDKKPLIAVQSDPKMVQSDPKEVGVIRTKPNKKDKHVADGQLNMFDFI